MSQNYSEPLNQMFLLDREMAEVSEDYDDSGDDCEIIDVENSSNRELNVDETSSTTTFIDQTDSEPEDESSEVEYNVGASTSNGFVRATSSKRLRENDSSSPISDELNFELAFESVQGRFASTMKALEIKIQKEIAFALSTQKRKLKEENNEKIKKMSLQHKIIEEKWRKDNEELIIMISLIKAEALNVKRENEKKIPGCIICFNSDSKFVWLPCSHTICRLCLPNLASGSKDSGKKKKCPWCNQIFQLHNVKPVFLAYPH